MQESGQQSRERKETECTSYKEIATGACRANEATHGRQKERTRTQQQTICRDGRQAGCDSKATSGFGTKN